MLGRSPDIRWHHSQQSFWFTSELVISWRSKKIAHVSSSNHSSEKIEGQRAKAKGQRAKGTGQRAKGKNHKLIFYHVGFLTIVEGLSQPGTTLRSNIISFGT